jgi:hypothetical protein
MKKLSFLFAALFLLTACNVGVEQVLEQPSPDGIEVDHGEVFGRVTSIDENSVRFSTNVELADSQSNAEPEDGGNTYALSKDVVIKVMEGDQLVELPRERVMEISTSSNLNDYLFYFVLTSDEVLSMTQAYMPAEGFDSNSDDLVYVTNVYEKDGKNFITVDPMQMLDCSDSECPNGFEIKNTEVEAVDYEVPTDKTVFFVIDWGTSTAPAYPMDFADFEAKFTKEKENFGVIPYHLQTEGQQLVSLTEKYLP